MRNVCFLSNCLCVICAEVGEWSEYLTRHYLVIGSSSTLNRHCGNPLLTGTYYILYIPVFHCTVWNIYNGTHTRKLLRFLL